MREYMQAYRTERTADQRETEPINGLGKVSIRLVVSVFFVGAGARITAGCSLWGSSGSPGVHKKIASVDALCAALFFEEIERFNEIEGLSAMFIMESIFFLQASIILDACFMVVIVYSGNSKPKISGAYFFTLSDEILLVLQMSAYASTDGRCKRVWVSTSNPHKPKRWFQPRSHSKLSTKDQWKYPLMGQV